MSTFPSLDNDLSPPPSFDGLPADLPAREIFDALGSPIAVIDSTGKIVAINEAWRNFAIKYGSTAGINGAAGNCLSGWLNTLHPEILDTTREVMNGVEKVLRRETAEFEHVYPCHFPDAQRWLLLRCTTIRTEAGYAILCHTDITERMLAENALSKLQHFADDIQHQLRERQRLEQILVHNQKLEAIGHLAGGIAHDFNNILAAIMGYSELALKKIQDADSREYIQGALKACHRAKDLIQQILMFSRKSDGHLMPLDLRFILKETLPLIRASLPAAITIYDRLDSGCPATIRGNPAQLQRVFMNLCANAAQAMRDSGGILIVKLSQIKVDETLRESCPELQPNTTCIELTVRDTGTGIEKEHLASIFEPYYSTKVPGKGTGLGLAVVHGIMRQHNGGVAVRTFPDHGTTFSLYFPLFEQTVPAGAIKEKTASSSKGSAHILIVDDEEVIVEVLRKVLEGQGYTTTCCQHPKDALTLFKESPHSYDLVLCDLSMPEMPGDVLAKKMKQIRKDIPIILCTGHLSEQLQGVDGSSVDRILHKPIPQAELASALQQALKKKHTPRS